MPRGTSPSAVSPDGVTVDGRWFLPVDINPGSSLSLFAYGADATDLGLFACINEADTCVALPPAN